MHKMNDLITRDTDTPLQVLKQALAWHQSGDGAALATVTRTWGSAPRRVGAQMAISGKGEIAGSVSGGCVEAAVIVEALDALQQGAPRKLHYGVSDGDAFAVGLACGGEIGILVEPVGAAFPEVLLERLVAALTARRPAALVVNSDADLHELATTGYAERFLLDQSGFEADGTTFVAVFNPPLRLIVVGAVHIAQALAPMARLAGFAPFIIDPRGAFATAERFPGEVTGESLLEELPDVGIQQIGLDARTAVVLLTHDPKLDDPALHLALESGAFYVGALGSRRTHDGRIARLRQVGFDKRSIARISAPIGLDIGATNPNEIAVAVLGDIIHSLRKPA